MDKINVTQVEEGDVIALDADDQTDWVVTDVSGYSDGDVILHVNGPRPGIVAVLTLSASTWVYVGL